MISLVIAFKFYNWSRLSIAWFPLCLTLLSFEVLIFDGFVVCVFTYVSTYYTFAKIERINANVISNKMTKFMIIKFMYQHNRLCTQIHFIDIFTKESWLVFIVCIFPATLIIFHQVLFEDLDQMIKVLYLSVNLVFYSILFIIQYFLALISLKIHKMFKVLSRIQWTLNSQQIDLRFKLKVMTYFERLSSSRRIGFSIGSVAIMTFPLFSGVSFSPFQKFLN